jgi:hypothetical protein
MYFQCVPCHILEQQQEAERIRAAAAAGGTSSNGIENSASHMAALMDDLEDGETPTVYT